LISTVWEENRAHRLCRIPDQPYSFERLRSIMLVISTLKIRHHKKDFQGILCRAIANILEGIKSTEPKTLAVLYRRNPPYRHLLQSFYKPFTLL
jgi:hypothetical protein